MRTSTSIIARHVCTTTWLPLQCITRTFWLPQRSPWLRAFVLGALDGLVSVASIMVGVGGGSDQLSAVSQRLALLLHSCIPPAPDAIVTARADETCRHFWVDCRCPIHGSWRIHIGIVPEGRRASRH